MPITRRSTLSLMAAVPFLMRGGNRAWASGSGAAQQAPEQNFMQCNLLAVPNIVQLDLTGPFEVLSRAPGVKIDIVAATADPIVTDRGLSILPTVTRESSRPSDILLVPGGSGIDVAMLDPAWIAYVRKEAAAAKYIVGVCTGSLMLGAAGLLEGRRAGGHWQARDLLESFGANVSNDRITVDGNIYTSGGVTSGIDMGLFIVALLTSEKIARSIQLAMEYDPAPPFPGGTPLTSPPDIVQAVLEQSKAKRAVREQRVALAASYLRAEQLRQ